VEPWAQDKKNHTEEPRRRLVQLEGRRTRGKISIRKKTYDKEKNIKRMRKKRKVGEKTFEEV